MNTRNRPRRILLSLFLALTCPACGLQQDISFDEPEAVSPEGASVVVAWDGNEAEVFLTDLDPITVEGRSVYPLWDILLAAGLEEEEVQSMCFDFEADDGFRPSSVGCEPLEGEDLALGYLDPDGMALVWDSTLGLRGCYWVNRIVRILGEPA